MTAIHTKLIGQTTNKPYRIKAWDSNGNKVIISADSITINRGLAQMETHKVAANELKRKLGLKGKLAGGDTKEGFVFCFVK